VHVSSLDETSRSSRNAAFVALLLGMLLAQLDTNVVVAAWPTIASDLGDADAVAGVTAIYLLTVTVSTPVLGKLGDMVGRRTVFVASLLTFSVASLACAAAPSLLALVSARALQGVGGGGLVVTAIAAMGELFDRDELVRRQIWLTSSFGVASLAGPPLGGLVAAGPGWQWIFLINLPISALAVAVGLCTLPSRARGGSRPPGFDGRGAVLIAVGGACIVALGSSASLAENPLWAPVLAVSAAVCTIGFVRTERRAASRLIPPSLFGIPTLARSIAATGLSGFALFGIFTFVPLAVTAGTGLGPGPVGTLLLALTGGQLALATTFAVLVRRRPNVAAWGRLGLALGAGGLLLLAVVPQLPDAADALTVGLSIVDMALAGAALGLTLSAYTLLGQTTAPREHFGASMATLTFARQLGGSIGAATFGWILLTITDSTTALTTLLAIAAAAIAAGFMIAPRTAPPARDPDTRPMRRPRRERSDNADALVIADEAVASGRRFCRSFTAGTSSTTRPASARGGEAGARLVLPSALSRAVGGTRNIDVWQHESGSRTERHRCRKHPEGRRQAISRPLRRPAWCAPRSAARASRGGRRGHTDRPHSWFVADAAHLGGVERAL
jgi:MFS family permease